MPAPRSDPRSRTNQDQPDAPRIDDKRFLQDAALGGLTEVALGKLAIEKGSSDAVKQFGQKMIVFWDVAHLSQRIVVAFERPIRR